MDYPNHVGNGVYELSDGERIRGKQAAIEIEIRLSGTERERLTQSLTDTAEQIRSGYEMLPPEARELIDLLISIGEGLAVEPKLEEEEPSTPEGYKGPLCPKCGDYRIRVLSAEREAAESQEPTHRKAVGVKILPALYVCPCGKRFSVK